MIIIFKLQAYRYAVTFMILILIIFYGDDNDLLLLKNFRFGSV